MRKKADSFLFLVSLFAFAAAGTKGGKCCIYERLNVWEKGVCHAAKGDSAFFPCCCKMLLPVLNTGAGGKRGGGGYAVCLTPFLWETVECSGCRISIQLIRLFALSPFPPFSRCGKKIGRDQPLMFQQGEIVRNNMCVGYAPFVQQYRRSKEVSAKDHTCSDGFFTNVTIARSKE